MRRIHGVTFVLGCLLASPLLAETPPRPDIEKELATLRDSLHKGNVDDAVAAGERAVKAWADAHWRRGQILEKLNRKNEAKAEYESALKLAPGHNGATKGLKQMKG